MIVGDCTEGVTQVKSIADLQRVFPDSDYNVVKDELNSLFASFEKIGIKVFVGPNKNFPPMTRGVYKTEYNAFYLNEFHVELVYTLISVMRHEGWHAAQDCMAGTIDNTWIAIIVPEATVPQIWRDLVERVYPEHVRPWEAEASWAGRTEGMTAKALAACAAGNMWEVYEPTPLTRKYLIDNGFIKE